ncbi:Rieske 2Fe-2S domain-containing protein [Haloarchaeobius litoreus]|uniref:Rieske 2Fe-2S domain-containing protein n=1 Tax=Haloarchaeobius litoreus TaxID=755306 RepID=A0ABD6DQL8_9EURY|nr:Rieske 2Fe-2S domain-containing protein [Haloarchaeobius litoreus]
MATTDKEFVRVSTLAELRDEGRTLVTEGGHAIALFHHEGEVRAVDNRCPHMGFPLVEGTVDEGVLTCHWHHARFELGCGDTFDPWADDVATYPVEVRDGEVFVRPQPRRDAPPAEHWRSRLQTGLEENLRLVVAKAVIGLDDAGVDRTDVLDRGVRFGTQYREGGWSSGLTILAAMANVALELDPDDRKRAMYTGLRHVASDCAGEPPRFAQPPFEREDVDPDRLASWFRENVEVRDEDGAERVLRTAVAACDRDAVERMLYAAATDHRYLDTGHTFDFVNKAIETLDHVGWDHADDTLASLIPSLTDAERSEELSSWRQPVDLAGLVEDVTAELDDLAARGADDSWTEPDEFRDLLLSDDPHAIVDGIRDAIAEGATPQQLASAVAAAAATRVAQFGTSNEFSDWNTVHHTFTYANAVHQATRRVDDPVLYRGVLDGAVNVYLDRFLNTPPAPVPGPGKTQRAPDAILDDLDEMFDTEGRVNEAGRLVAGFLDSGGDPADLKRRLGHALLREDAGFHTLQALEAGFRQFDCATDDHDRRVAMVAVARYLAAHFPTRREAEQTFTIASRLLRGEAVHEEGEADD